jgi:hypothetical protein
MRLLNEFEINNTSYLARLRINFTLLEPTRTGLEKSIMDATANVRLYLKENMIHDYEMQIQGQKSKRIVPSYILMREKVIETKTSLYRPCTKKGDPRIWIGLLNRFSQPNDIILMIVFNNRFLCINITRINLEELYEVNNLFMDAIRNLSQSLDVAHELSIKLREIASRCPVRAPINDTAIGFLLETQLGIKRNSSEQPDYKGIELKSYRGYGNSKGNRVTLFGKVPNWELSKFKSSREILKHIGYIRGGLLRLNCTVSTQNFNSQGLRFRMNNKENLLEEFCSDKNIGDVAVWALERLHKKLLLKHNETFWVAAKNKKYKDLGYEDFWFTKVLHTQKPLPAQFDLLISQGMITLDHLSKIDSSDKMNERGPLFRIEKPALNILFPIVNKFSLIS